MSYSKTFHIGFFDAPFAWKNVKKRGSLRKRSSRLVISIGESKPEAAMNRLLMCLRYLRHSSVDLTSLTTSSCFSGSSSSLSFIIIVSTPIRRSTRQSLRERIERLRPPWHRSHHYSRYYHHHP